MGINLYPGGGASSEVVGSAIDDLSKMKFAQKQLNESIKAANAKVMAEAQAAKVRNVHDTGMKIFDFLQDAARYGYPYELVYEVLKQQAAQGIIDPAHLTTREEYATIVQKQGQPTALDNQVNPSGQPGLTPIPAGTYNTEPGQPSLAEQIQTQAQAQPKPNAPEYVTGGLPSGLVNQNPPGVRSSNVFEQEIDSTAWNRGTAKMYGQELKKKATGYNNRGTWEEKLPSELMKDWLKTIGDITTSSRQLKLGVDKDGNKLTYIGRAQLEKQIAYLEAHRDEIKPAIDRLEGTPKKTDTERKNPYL